MKKLGKILSLLMCTVFIGMGGVLVTSCSDDDDGGSELAAKTLSSITVDASGVSSFVEEQEEPDWKSTGLVVTKRYSDDTSEATTDYTVTGWDSSQATDALELTVTVTEDGVIKTGTFSVKIISKETVANAALESISATLAGTANITTESNEAAVKAALTVKAKLEGVDDEVTLAAADYTLSTIDFDNTESAQTITVSYTKGDITETTTFSLTVQEAPAGDSVTKPVITGAGVADNALSLEADGSVKLTASATGSGNVTYAWTVTDENSVVTKSGENTAELTLTANNTAAAQKTVTVTVKATSGTASETSDALTITVKALVPDYTEPDSWDFVSQSADLAWVKAATGAEGGAGTKDSSASDGITYTLDSAIKVDGSDEKSKLTLNKGTTVAYKDQNFGLRVNGEAVKITGVTGKVIVTVNWKVRGGKASDEGVSVDSRTLTLKVGNTKVVGTAAKTDSSEVLVGTVDKVVTQTPITTGAITLSEPSDLTLEASKHVFISSIVIESADDVNTTATFFVPDLETGNLPDTGLTYDIGGTSVGEKVLSGKIKADTENTATKAAVDGIIAALKAAADEAVTDTDKQFAVTADMFDFVFFDAEEKLAAYESAEEGSDAEATALAAKLATVEAGSNVYVTYVTNSAYTNAIAAATGAGVDVTWNLATNWGDKIENTEGFVKTEVSGTEYSFKVDASSKGKLEYVSKDSRTQINASTKLLVPVSAGSKISVTSDQKANVHYTINGIPGYDATSTYTAATAGYVEVVAVTQSYLTEIKVTELVATEEFPTTKATFVSVPAEEVTVTPATVSVEKGKSTSLTVSLTPADTTDVIAWSVDTGATITEQSMFSATVKTTAEGTTTVTAKANDSVSGTSVITVNPASTDFVVADGVATLNAASYVFMLTKTNITDEANTWITNLKDNWVTGKSYGNDSNIFGDSAVASADYYNMTSTDRTLEFSVKGVAEIDIYYMGNSDARDTKITIVDGEASAQEITYNANEGSKLQYKRITCTATNTVKITLGGAGKAVYPVGLILKKTATVSGS